MGIFGIDTPHTRRVGLGVDSELVETAKSTKLNFVTKK